MSKSLSLATVVEKNKIASDTAFLVLLDINVIDPGTNQLVDVIRLVRNNEDITWQGNTYTAAPFTIDLTTDAGSAPQVKLSITDFSRTIQAQMQAYSGGVGSKVTVSVVNADALDVPPEVQEFFMVVDASAANYITTWTLGTESPLYMMFPRGRQMRDRCRWIFKDQNCAYAGSMTSCDYSLKGANGCEKHSNVINFGGLPGIDPNGAKYG